jgi:hypothetical protein
MKSIAEKYAAQWMPNGEVSVVELIEAALREQSVPVMGPAVAIGRIDLSRNDPIALDSSLTYGFLRPFDGMEIVIASKPPTSITAAELAEKDARIKWLEDQVRSLALGKCASDIKASRLENAKAGGAEKLDKH